MNSREKGKRGERQWRDELRANGYAARRGQQYAGTEESPDVICESLSSIHFEVKAVERLRIHDAMNQARKDCGSEKVPIVVHKRNYRMWLVNTNRVMASSNLLRDSPMEQRLRWKKSLPLPARSAV